MDYFISNKIIDEPIFYYKGTRDDPDINIYICEKTGAFILDKIKKQNYENKGLDYWNCNKINEARKKTYDDDIRRYNQIKNLKFNSILDFGCGNGGLLKIMVDNSYKKCFGVELNNHMINFLNSEGINVVNDINKISNEINLDCIMLNHVLEHLSDPINVLKQIKKKMTNKTLLIIEVPHSNDILLQHYECNEFKKFTFWSEHLILHSEKSLLNLLNAVGFSSIDIKFYQRYNIFNHLFWLSNGAPGGHKKTKFKDSNLVDSYNNFLINNKNTDTLIAYCYI